MRFTSDAELEAIAHGIVHRTLPKTEWTHAAHFAFALWMLREVRTHEVGTAIRAYNESVGTANTDSSGYHETITQASMQIAQLFREGHAGKPLFGICNELLASPVGQSNWLLSYWSKDRLFSPEARQQWVEPNLQPLPLYIDAIRRNSSGTK